MMAEAIRAASAKRKEMHRDMVLYLFRQRAGSTLRIPARLADDNFCRVG
jgi:hypothetical protein